MDEFCAGCAGCAGCEGGGAVDCMDCAAIKEILVKVFGRIRPSHIKHGNWANYSVEKVFEEIAGEFDEYREAVVANELSGRHGQISELFDLIVTAAKGIRRLSAEVNGGKG